MLLATDEYNLIQLLEKGLCRVDEPSVYLRPQRFGRSPPVRPASGRAPAARGQGGCCPAPRERVPVASGSRSRYPSSPLLPQLSGGAPGAPLPREIGRA